MSLISYGERPSVRSPCCSALCKNSDSLMEGSTSRGMVNEERERRLFCDEETAEVSWESWELERWEAVGV